MLVMGADIYLLRIKVGKQESPCEVASQESPQDRGHGGSGLRGQLAHVPSGCPAAAHPIQELALFCAM